MFIHHGSFCCNAFSLWWFVSNMKPILWISYLLVLFSWWWYMNWTCSYGFTQTSEICRSLQNLKSKTMWSLDPIPAPSSSTSESARDGAWRESLAARVGSVPGRLNPASSPLPLQTWNVPSRILSSCFARFLWKQTPSGKDSIEMYIYIDFIFMVTFTKID